MRQIFAKKVGDEWYALYAVSPANNVEWAVYMNRAELHEVKRSAERVLLNLTEEQTRGKQGSVDRSSRASEQHKG